MDIKSHLGVGDLTFLSIRQTIRTIFAKYKVELFNRTAEVQIPADYFEELGLFVYYDKRDVCEALEFADELDLTFEGIHFFKLPYSKIEVFFSGLDENIEIDESGFISFELGIGVYAPFKSEDASCKVESVIVFRKGYYD